MIHHGRGRHRLNSNPLEKAFADAWESENAPRSGRPHGLLDWLKGDGNRPGIVTQEEATIAATVVQWLGSTVGQSFLADVLAKPEADAFRWRLSCEMRRAGSQGGSIALGVKER